MRIAISKPFLGQAEFFVRRAGYGQIYDRTRGEESYVYRLSRTAFYPRFHLYIEKDEPGSMVLNLHLDQKQPSYAGSHMHSGEYEGEIIEKEAARIKTAITKTSSE